MKLDIQHLMRPGTLSLPSLPPLSVYVHLPAPHQRQTGFNIGTQGVKVSSLRQLGLTHFM